MLQGGPGGGSMGAPLGRPPLDRRTGKRRLLVVVWAADPAAPARIRRWGGRIEAEEHEADGEVAGRRRAELQGGGVVPW